jgi:pimeloyl-ACP methyl ester carboxylesterase
VCFIQGVGVVGAGWRPQTDVLRDRFRTVRFDNRGMGASPLTRGAELSIPRMADDGLALLDALGIAKAHVVGHSMGGLIAQELALRAPDRVASLALLCTFLHGKQGAWPSPSAMWIGLRCKVGTPAMRRRAFLDLITPAPLLRGSDPEALAKRLGDLFGHDLAHQPPFAWQQVRAMGRYDGSPRIAALADIPTLVVSAEDDRLARPEFGEALARAIPGSRFERVPGQGHNLPILHAEWTNEVLERHWNAARTALPA